MKGRHFQNDRERKEKRRGGRKGKKERKMGGLSDKDGGPVLPPLVKSQIGLSVLFGPMRCHCHSRTQFVSGPKKTYQM